MKVNPMKDQPVSLLDDADGPPVQLADRRRYSMRGNRGWLVKHLVAAFPCPITELDILPVIRRQEFLEAAHRVRLGPVEHRRAAAGECRVKRDAWLGERLGTGDIA